MVAGIWRIVGRGSGGIAVVLAVACEPDLIIGFAPKVDPTSEPGGSGGVQGCDCPSRAGRACPGAGGGAGEGDGAPIPGDAGGSTGSGGTSGGLLSGLCLIPVDNAGRGPSSLAEALSGSGVLVSGQAAVVGNDWDQDGQGDLAYVGDHEGTPVVSVLYGRATLPSAQSGDLGLGAPKEDAALILPPDSAPKVTYAGDPNGDGFSDLLVSTSTAALYVVYGARERLAGAVDVNEHPNIARLTVDLPPPWEATGLGDVNGDGFDDFALTALQDGGPYALLCHGRPDRLSGILPVDADLAWAGAGQSWHLIPAGDVNADGFADLLVAEDTSSEEGPRLVLLLGSRESLTAGEAAGATLILGATDAAPAGDLDGDGAGDLLVDDHAITYVFYGCPRGELAPHVRVEQADAVLNREGPLSAGSPTGDDRAGLYLLGQ